MDRRGNEAGGCAGLMLVAYAAVMLVMHKGRLNHLWAKLDKCGKHTALVAVIGDISTTLPGMILVVDACLGH